ncbi:MAG: DUF6655 family protein [Thermoguttaceae bacterium]
MVAILSTTGCGTTKWTDTSRSATEQLLISDAMDRAVSELDLRAMAGKTVFVDSTPLKKVTDCEYLISCLRQHMLASECIIKDEKSEADYIVEVRAGSVGTDHHDLLYGIPAVTVPTVMPVPGIPSQIPEIPIIKKTDQRAVVKLSLFAYNQKTGRPIWQSGSMPQESAAKALWVFGAGPFQRGTIYQGMEFAGNKLDMPLVDIYKSSDHQVSVADEAFFVEPKERVVSETKGATAVAAGDAKKPGSPKPETGKGSSEPVTPAGHAEPSASGGSAGAAPGAGKGAAAGTAPASAAAAAPASAAEGVPGPATAATGGGLPSKPVAAGSARPAPPVYSPNDLAPALAELEAGSEPKLLPVPTTSTEPGAVGR